MLSDKTKKRLYDMLESTNDVLDFISNIVPETYANDKKTYLAVMRSLEIISEASRNVDDDIKQCYPELKWRDMADAGNLSARI